MRAVRVRIHGRVQGVFFRVTTRERATALGVRGWVRNRPDGTVEALLAGPDDAVERALEFVRTGPPAARVERVDVQAVDVPDDLPEGFEIRG